MFPTSKREYTNPALQNPQPKGSYKKSKSLVTAYVLALLLGWVGAHRFYLGHLLAGLVYMFTLGGFGIGIIIDLIYLPSIVAKANTESELEDVQIINEADIRIDPSINPLSSAFFLWSWFKYFMFILSMIIAPFLFYNFFGDPSFAIIIFLLYFVAVFNKWFAMQIANQEFIIWKVPGVQKTMATIVNGFAKLRSYYASRPPVGWLRSHFSVFLLPFSTDVRTEWKLFNGLLAFGIIFVIWQYVGWGWEYFTLYTPELTAMNLFETKLIMIALSSLFVLMLVIPIIRTLTYVELAGQVNRGRWMVFIALGGVFVLSSHSVTESYFYEDYQRLKLRLNSSEHFSKKFDPFVKTFLQQHYRPAQFSTRVTDEGKLPIVFQLRNTQLAFATSMQLTRKFRKELVSKKIVVRSEVNGFRVLAFDSSINGKWHPGLLIYSAYGTNDDDAEGRNKNKNLDWHILKTENGVSRKKFVSIREIELLYRILLTRMESMDKGDQLSPDFKG